MNNVIKYLYITAFVGTIIGLPVLSLLKIQTSEPAYFVENEKRPISKLDSLSAEKEKLDKFFGGLEQFVNDRLAFREKFLDLHSFISFRLGLLPNSEKVIFGKDGWLFYKLTNYTSLKPTDSVVSYKEWNQHLSDYFSSINQFLSKRGIIFKLMIPPTKEEIYPEYLPYKKTMTATNFERLIKHADLPVLNLKEVFLANKADDLLLYYKTDNHWNKLGAYYAYEVLMESISDSLNYDPIFLDYQYFKSVKTRKSFDLVQLVHGQGYFEDINQKLIRNPFGQYEIQVIAMADKNGKWTNKPAGSATDVFQAHIVKNEFGSGTLLIIGDSFSTALSHYLNATFNTIVYVHYAKFNQKTIASLVYKYNPQVVVYEIVDPVLSNRKARFIPLMAEPVQTNMKTEIKTLVNVELGDVKIAPGTKENISNLTFSENGLAFTATGADPKLLLPVFAVPASLVIKIDITSSVATSLQVFYKTTSQPDYNREQSVKARISEGRQELLLTIPSKNITGSLRLDPGSHPGNYCIHNIEVCTTK